MATRNSFLVNWVKTAYSMEMGLVPMLERQRTQVQGDPDLRRSIDVHMQQTRHHVELLRDRLQSMGESAAGLQPSAPITEAYDRADGSAPDGTQRAELIDYVTESFEWASYRALKALAIELGDNETARLCDQILQDEMAATIALDRRLPGRNGAEAPAERAAGVQSEIQDHIRLARANFDALNAHDVDRWERDLAPDFRGQGPGMPGEVGLAQNRAQLQAYMTAFPDIHWEIGRILASGNGVLVEWVGSGTHTGPLVTPDGRTIPPTGKATRLRGHTVFEFKGGKISRAHVLFDTGDLMRQLGLLPGSATNAKGEPNREFVHLEIPAKDPKAAAEFYGKMFGWDHEHDDQMDYTTFRSGNVGGGFVPVSDIYQPGGAVPYVGSNDIDADLRRAEKLGAKTVVPKTEIPGMGWFAIFADPTGNRFGLFSM